MTSETRACLYNMAHYLEHQIWRYVLDSGYAYYTNAFTDALGTIHLNFIVETFKI